MDLVTTGLLHDGQTITERRSQDVEPILDHVKGLVSVGEVGSSEMKHAAKLPKAVIETYLAQNGISFHEFMTNEVHVRRMLNDPSLSGFRIWKGRV